jgi:cell division protein FtsW
MARKLKSDKVLFLATLLLVCASVVMVYSASAVLAMQRYNQPYYFLIRQGMWAALGLAAMSLAMRFDYRHYREPSFIWMALGVVTLALVVVLFGRPINGSSRWFGYGGIGVQPSGQARRDLLHFGILERRMDRIDGVQHAPPHRAGGRDAGGPDSGRAGHGHRDDAGPDRAAMVFAAG